jgi:hypothetical protein
MAAKSGTLCLPEYGVQNSVDARNAIAMIATSFDSIDMDG